MLCERFTRLETCEITFSTHFESISGECRFEHPPKSVMKRVKSSVRSVMEVGRAFVESEALIIVSETKAEIFSMSFLLVSSSLVLFFANSSGRKDWNM